jgi:hypothetical protein
MTIRYSAALPTVRNYAPVGLGRVPVSPAANDNPRDMRNDPVLRAALRHFAAHGLGAAADARRRALTALRANDTETYQQWYGICAKLDRRLASTLQTALRDRHA